MLSENEIRRILEGLVDDYHAGHFVVEPQQPQSSNPKRAEQVLGECILSSGWAYAKACAAMEEIRINLIRSCDGRPKKAQETIHQILTTNTHAHRFPNSRSKQLAQALDVLWDHAEAGQLNFPNFMEADELRTYFIERFPGIGLKQASMLIRDLSISTDLAIVDRHIIWYFDKIYGVELNPSKRKDYEEAEKILRRLSIDLNVSLGVLDSIIWCLVIEYKQRLKEDKWKKSFAWHREVSTHQLAFTF